MTIEEQIVASVNSGLTRSGIEALIGRSFTDDELQTYRKAKAIYDLKLRKRRQERKYEHLSNTEAKRKHDDKQASIDQELDDAYARIDWDRRNAAKKSLADFIRTYLVGSLFVFEPEKHMEEAIAEMFRALTDSRPYNIELSRGCGKTTVSEAMILYLVAYGLRKFCVIVSQNARSAQNILKDIYRVVSEQDSPLVQDFPDMCLPFITCNGFTRRMQKYRGVSVDIERNATSIVFPRITRNGEEVPTCGSVITARGITSGIRGLKVGKLRPDLVLLDDIQTAESAASSEQVAKLLDLINKDIMNLSSKGKLSVLMTSTPICPEDLCETIENDVNWKTTKFPAMIAWPNDIVENGDEGLWGHYFQIYDKESMTDSPHDESLKFYKDNFDAMNEGAEIFASRFKESDGHISGLQALLEKRHLIGNDAFDAEMQMKPKKLSFSIDVSPKIVLQRIGKTQEFEVPDGYTFVAASTDLNTAYAITTSIVAFKRDLTAVVVHHEVMKSRIDQKLNDTEYNQKVYAALERVAKRLQSYPVKVNAWGIDAGGRNFSSVCQFAKNAFGLCGISACSMVGVASHKFSTTIRSRLRDAQGRTVLCGDAQEQLKTGAGIKWLRWDSDFYREVSQRSVYAPLGSQGGCALYDGTPEEHSDFAQQFCNERLKFVKHHPNGTCEYFWTTKEPHDFLDTMGMCYACAAVNGINGEVRAPRGASRPLPTRRPGGKPRIRFV